MIRSRGRTRWFPGTERMVLDGLSRWRTPRAGCWQWQGPPHPLAPRAFGVVQRRVVNLPDAARPLAPWTHTHGTGRFCPCPRANLASHAPVGWPGKWVGTTTATGRADGTCTHARAGAPALLPPLLHWKLDLRASSCVVASDTCKLVV